MAYGHYQILTYHGMGPKRYITVSSSHNIFFPFCFGWDILHSIFHLFIETTKSDLLFSLWQSRSDGRCPNRGCVIKIYTLYMAIFFFCVCVNKIRWRNDWSYFHSFNIESETSTDVKWHLINVGWTYISFSNIAIIRSISRYCPGSCISNP